MSSRVPKIVILMVFFCLLFFVSFAESKVPKANEFKAEGPTEPKKLGRGETAVKVYFEDSPCMMRFNLPAFPCMVTENDIQFSNCYAETYEPREGGGSFEVQMDRANRYARFWIKSQNDARIVVRARGVLCNGEGIIAHTDISSGSPYGKGDWVDEWDYIYPDTTHTRKVHIYTGLASRSKPFGFDREPPEVVHEFMEATIFGHDERTPTEVLNIEGLILIKMFGDHSELVFEDGRSKKISFKPYPEGFGDYRDANIMVINTKSKHKPFTVAMPYGVRMQPYRPEGDLPYVFQTWGDPKGGRYATALGHILNYWHYRRADNYIEQVYLSGLTDAEEPAEELVPLGFSWIIPPRIRMEGLEYDYETFTYDQSQKAYILDCKAGAKKLEFSMNGVEVDMFPMRIVNPAFVLEGWGDAKPKVTIDGRKLEAGKDYRFGTERGEGRTDMIVWIRMKSLEDVEFVIAPAK